MKNVGNFAAAVALACFTVACAQTDAGVCLNLVIDTGGDPVSATLNGQYYHTEFTLKDGSSIRGSVIDVVGGKLDVVHTQVQQLRDFSLKSERFLAGSGRHLVSVLSELDPLG